MSALRLTTAAAVLALGAAVLTAAPVASAKNRDVRVRGTCTAGSTVKLKLGDEDGRIEVELEVDQNRNGVPWKVALRRNGARVASAAARTHAPSGSFTVRRVVAGAPGTDRVVAVATRAGERCSARASL